MKPGPGWSALLALATAIALAAPPVYPPVVPGRGLMFPRDHGAHPDYKTEWWYTTGWLETNNGKPLGFQITFFRSRPNLDQANPSRFAPTQLLFAHAALSDPEIGHLIHAQRSARAGFGLAEADSADTNVHIDDWSLRRAPDGQYAARITGLEMQFDLKLVPSEAPLPEGEDGYSRKGPRPAEASYYYSQPQLRVSGSVMHGGQQEGVRGVAWLDHEWSSAMLPESAVGWDWIGINLDDGGALMAFRIRDAAGRALWSYANRRGSDGVRVKSATTGIAFVPTRLWHSPRTGTGYPVQLHVRAADLEFDLVPLQDDQELDARTSTGTVYWEGAVTAVSNGKRLGRGYLELTGYFRPLKL